MKELVTGSNQEALLKRAHEVVERISQLIGVSVGGSLCMMDWSSEIFWIKKIGDCKEALINLSHPRAEAVTRRLFNCQSWKTPPISSKNGLSRAIIIPPEINSRKKGLIAGFDGSDGDVNEAILLCLFTASSLLGVKKANELAKINENELFHSFWMKCQNIY